jgi:hypothetical protein
MGKSFVAAWNTSFEFNKMGFLPNESIAAWNAFFCVASQTRFRCSSFSLSRSASGRKASLSFSRNAYRCSWRLRSVMSVNSAATRWWTSPPSPPRLRSARSAPSREQGCSCPCTGRCPLGKPFPDSA